MHRVQGCLLNAVMMSRCTRTEAPSVLPLLLQILPYLFRCNCILSLYKESCYFQPIGATLPCAYHIAWESCDFNLSVYFCERALGLFITLPYGFFILPISIEAESHLPLGS